MKYIALFISILLILTSCDTKKMTNVLTYRSPYGGNVEIKGIGEAVPSESTFLGTIFVGEKGMTRKKNCTWQAVLADAVHLAKSMGGNMIVITEHREPNVWISTCHQISANVYYVNPTFQQPGSQQPSQQLQMQEAQQQNTTTAAKAPQQPTPIQTGQQAGIIYHGRMLSCRLLSSISSAYPSGMATMIVNEDFKDPDGKVLIAKGTPVKASFSSVPAKGIKSPGQVTLTVQSTESIDGQTILLTGSQTVIGEIRASHYNASMPVNTIMNVFIQGSYEVR